MRKRYWVLLAFLALGGIGNLVGGTDTPVRGSVDADRPVSAPATDVATPGFDAVLYVSAGSLNLREAPGTDAPVLASLPRNTAVRAGERRGAWTFVSARRMVGWVSRDYLSTGPMEADPGVVRQSQPATKLAEAPAASCPSRRYCRQIGSCEEARFYLANCSWGPLLDADSDGVPCESICR
jgi:uncharacterized protein YgiM (DUF1202 family)